MRMSECAADYRAYDRSAPNRAIARTAGDNHDRPPGNGGGSRLDGLGRR